ncbi:MAG: hypothetical protein WC607_03620 [Candidatus Micrarchaeia archaeon]
MNNWTKLALSLGIDAVGMASLFTATEPTDLVWAPLSGVAIWMLYRDELAGVGGFAEELLPGFDWIPTATLAWFRSRKKQG